MPHELESPASTVETSFYAAYIPYIEEKTRLGHTYRSFINYLLYEIIANPEDFNNAYLTDEGIMQILAAAEAFLATSTPKIAIEAYVTSLRDAGYEIHLYSSEVCNNVISTMQECHNRIAAHRNDLQLDLPESRKQEILNAIKNQEETISILNTFIQLKEQTAAAAQVAPMEVEEVRPESSRSTRSKRSSLKLRPDGGGQLLPKRSKKNHP